MKVERKLSDFSTENENKMKIWKWKQNFAERKRKFFDESGNRNGTTFSGGTDAEMEYSVFD
jgi:hypothetical protein